MAKDRLVTPSYCYILAANFLLYFGFYLLMPILPFYLTEVFHTGNATVGIILSCYTIAALCIRPFSGYLLDTFSRKPLYLFAFFCFYQCICRLSDSRNTNFVHYHENYTRLFFRNCYRSGKYGGDRYYAILPERRRNRLLRIDKQHRHVYRPDGRAISA